MKRITQKQLASVLGLSAPYLSEILGGKKKPSASKSALLELVTGIGIRTWLFGKNHEMRRELERVYGKINFKRGRLPGKREVKK